MVEEIVEAGIQLRAHQEKASVDGGKHYRLRNSRDIVSLEEVKEAFFVEPKNHHAEQIFKDTHGCKDMEETVLGIVTSEPQIIGKSKENRPKAGQR